MTREEKTDWLLQYLKAENAGYAAIPDPVNFTEKRKLLRSLMNVRRPGEASSQYYEVQDSLLTEEAEEKGIVDVRNLSSVAEEFPENELRNPEKIYLWKGDITRLKCDAIVNAANSQLLGCFVPCHGCIDNAIHSAAGIQLRNECARIMAAQGHEEPVGRAKITEGYNLPAKYVIHTVGPVVGTMVLPQQKEELKNCYINSLKLAEKHHLESIAFCCISTGEFHFPNKLAAKIAVENVDKYLTKSGIKQVIFNVFKEEDYRLYTKKFLGTGDF
ncbi:protein-ADP-ribose hydrolase [Mordavella massiliensis]|uniref:Protein-ADP-ribose hydrolase n=1 Tax=Mordavella massiliensis TaxID=1871024 RepID=A0A939BCP5_9CLOT|nr:protein-ADP-ribose hydrolase [Mordavella massiliensis]MBM6827052.1 protein-ADP-ribose hydrolase [Mordavella massiliensis]